MKKYTNKKRKEEIKLKTSIVITFQFEGFHFWKNAFKEVEFLKNSHRHIFYFKLEKEVEHDDRDMEIIMFKRSVQNFLKKTYGGKREFLDFKGMSCEMIAKELVKQYDLVSCEVLEDNENGAKVYR